MGRIGGCGIALTFGGNWMKKNIAAVIATIFADAPNRRTIRIKTVLHQAIIGSEGINGHGGENFGN